MTNNDLPGPAVSTYLTAGGNPANERTLAILAEADRAAARHTSQPRPVTPPARLTLAQRISRWLGLTWE